MVLCCRRNSSVKTAAADPVCLCGGRPTRIISTAGFLPRCCAGALDRAAKQGMAASFLHPGEPGLIGYYAGFGYQPFFTVSRRVLTEATEERQPLENGNPFLLTLIRRCGGNTFPGGMVNTWTGRSGLWPTRLQWPKVWAAARLRMKRAIAHFVSRGTADCLCMSCCARRYAGEEAVRELLGRFGCCKAEVLSPPTAEKEVYGLWCPLSGEGDKRLHAAREPYMGVALE